MMDTIRCACGAFAHSTTRQQTGHQRRRDRGVVVVHRCPRCRRRWTSFVPDLSANTVTMTMSDLGQRGVDPGDDLPPEPATADDAAPRPEWPVGHTEQIHGVTCHFGDWGPDSKHRFRYHAQIDVPGSESCWVVNGKDEQEVKQRACDHALQVARQASKGAAPAGLDTSLPDTNKKQLATLKPSEKSFITGPHPHCETPGSYGWHQQNETPSPDHRDFDCRTCQDAGLLGGCYSCGRDYDSGRPTRRTMRAYRLRHNDQQRILCAILVPEPAPKPSGPRLSELRSVPRCLSLDQEQLTVVVGALDDDMLRVALCHVPASRRAGVTIYEARCLRFEPDVCQYYNIALERDDWPGGRNLTVEIRLYHESAVVTRAGVVWGQPPTFEELP